MTRRRRTLIGETKPHLYMHRGSWDVLVAPHLRRRATTVVAFAWCIRRNRR